MSNSKKKSVKSGNVFKSCPACESPNLLQFEGDAFCLYCDWDSVILREDARIEAQIQTVKEFHEEREAREVLFDESYVPGDLDPYRSIA